MGGKKFLRGISAVLSAVFFTQIIPANFAVFAEVKEYYYMALYNDTFTADRGFTEIEDSSQDPRLNHHFNLGTEYDADYSESITADENTSLQDAGLWPKPQNRITGLTFEGWYGRDESYELTKKATEETTFAELDDGNSFIIIEGKWIANADAGLNGISVLKAKDSDGDIVDTNIPLYSSDTDREASQDDFYGNPIDEIIQGTTIKKEFYTGLSGDASQVSLNFDIYEPDVDYKLEYSNDDGANYTEITNRVTEYEGTAYVPENPDEIPDDPTQTCTPINIFENEEEYSQNIPPEDPDKILDKLNNPVIKTVGDGTEGPNYSKLFTTQEVKTEVQGYWIPSLDLKYAQFAARTSQKIWANNIPVMGYGTDIVRLTVTPKNMTEGHAVEYIIHVNRSQQRIEMNYGNSVYGQIMKLSEDNKTAALAAFGERGDASTPNKYGANTYSADAWKNSDSDNTEILCGYEPQEGEYINYDKDDTAVIAYLGSSFADPGITVYAKDGSQANLAENNVTRTIKYKTLNNIQGWQSAAEVTKTDTLTGEDGENVIDYFKNVNEVIRPGVYTITYEYTEDGNTVSAVRNLVLLPKPGDTNLDNYVNSLDVPPYKYFDTISYGADIRDRNLYWFRALDISFDKQIDDKDYSYIYRRTGALTTYRYAELTQKEDTHRTAYTAPAAADGNKAQIYMDYLGKDKDNLVKKIDEPLKEGDVFWVGLRVTGLGNANAADVFNKKVYSMTLSLDYDNLFIAPATDTDKCANEDEWKTAITNYNLTSGMWANYSLTPYAAMKKTYSWTVDNTRASLDEKFFTQEGKTSNISTMVFDITANDNQTNNYRQLQNGDYLVKIPLKIIAKMPSDDRKLVSLALGAQTLSMSFGEYGKDLGTEWNTWGDDSAYKLNGVNKNLNGIVEYIEDLTLSGEEPTETVILDEGTYGVQYTYQNNDIKNQPYSADTLPPGITYEPSTGIITGYPEAVGTYNAKIGAKIYKIKINKKQMKVYPALYKADGTVDMQYNAQNQALPGKLGIMYGEPIGEIKTYYAIEDFEFDDSAEDLTNDTVNTTQPEWSSEIRQGDVYDTMKDVTNVSAGSNPNYEFLPQAGTIEVNKKRPLTVTAIDAAAIPHLSAAFVSQKKWSTAGTASTGDGSVTVDNLYSSDQVSVQITVSYSDYQSNPEPGENKRVKIIAVELLDKAINKTNNNYCIAGNNVPVSNDGVIEKKKVIKISKETDPEVNYTYGDRVNLSNGILVVMYDSGETSKVKYSELAGSGMRLYMKNQYLNASTPQAIEDAAVTSNQIMTLENSLDYFYVVSEDDPNINYTVNTPLKVVPRKITITVRNQEHVYGQPIDSLNITYAYDNSTLYAGDTFERMSDEYDDKYDPNFVMPTVTCSVGDNTSVGTAKGALQASGGRASNYYFEYVPGDLITAPRKIKLANITKNSAIPTLTSDVYMPDGNMTAGPWDIDGYATVKAVDSTLDEENSNAEVTAVDGETYSGVYGNDTIGIKYKVTYDRCTMDGQTYIPVTIDKSTYTLDTEQGEGKNYELVTDDTPNEFTLGRVLSEIISDFEIIEHPAKMEYTYGETLDLSPLKVKVTLDSGQVEELTEAELSTRGIRIVRTSESIDTPIKSGDKLLCEYTEKGSAVNLVAPVLANSYYYEKRMNVSSNHPNLTVNKKQLDVQAQGKTITYGDTPYISLKYTGFEWGENEKDAAFLTGFTKPDVILKNNENEEFHEDEKLVSGAYDIVLRNGEAANYEFNFINNQTLTVDKRPLDITGISKIPPLTPELASDGNYIHEISSKADNNPESGNLTLKNLASQTGWDPDLIRITYTAVYKGTTPTTNAQVDIKNIEFFDDKGDTNNNSYTIRNKITTTYGGVIGANEVSKIEIKENPTLKYEYGEYFNLNGGKIDIEYTSNNTETGLTLAELPDEVEAYAVSASDPDDKIKLTGTEELDVNTFNGRYLQLISKSTINNDGYEPITAQASGTIEITPKTLTVTPDNTEFIYGDTVPDITDSYSYSGFAYSDDEEKTVETKPVPSCEVSSLSDADEYDITVEDPVMKDGYANNYTVECAVGTMTVKPRVLHITSINNIPELKSAQLYQERNSSSHMVSATAKNSDMDITAADSATPGEGLIGNDEVEISYQAWYSQLEYYNVHSKMENVTVRIDQIKLTNTGKSGNYTLTGASLPTESDLGTVYQRVISEIEIQNGGQPKLEYHYADKLDLSKKGVTVKYDSGETFTDVAYNKLSDFGISMKYVDNLGDTPADTERTPVDKETVTVAYHHTKTIKLYIAAAAEQTLVETVTEPIEVEKHTINLKANDLTMTYGDTVMSDVVYNTDENGLVTEGSAMHVLTFSYDHGKLINGDTAIDGLKDVTLKCYDSGAAVNERTSVRSGGYVIDISGATADNYDFTYQTGTLTIEKCILDVMSVTVPDITSADLYKDYVKSVEEEKPELNLHHTYSYKAKNQNAAEGEQTAVLTNVKNNDTVGITFKATYDTDYYSLTKPEVTETKIPMKAKLTAIELDGASAVNYILADDASGATLRVILENNTIAYIHRREITNIDIVQNLKLGEYVYEEKFNADELTIKITYDSGEIVDNLPYAKIVNADETDDQYSRFITLKREDGKDVRTGDDINCNITGGNGQMIYLRAVTQAAGIESPIVKELGRITVVQKQLTITAEDKESTYGDYISEDLFTFVITDEQKGITVDSSQIPDFVAPQFDYDDEEQGTSVNEKSHVKDGGYEIVPSGASCENYSFVYITGTLTIQPRPIDVTSVTVPDITSADLYKDYVKSVEEGNPELNLHHTYSYKAKNQNAATGEQTAVLTNTANEDTVSITFKATYDTDYYGQTDTGSVKAKLSEIELDPEMASSKDYILSDDASGEQLQVIRDDNTYGVVHRREITDIKVTKNLNLGDYIYSETFDADGLTVTVSYDSGEVVENVTYKQIVNADGNDDQYSRFMTLKREDGSDARTGDALSCDYEGGNGQHVYLSAVTAAEGVTSPIVLDLGKIAVFQKRLRITPDNKQVTYGDEIPAFTYVIHDDMEGITIAIDDMPEGYTEPAIVCYEDETAEEPVQVSVKTHVKEGGYNITASGASAGDYCFIYDVGNLNIVPRVIDIESVTVPELTSAKLYADYLNGEKYHTLDAYAINKPSEDKEVYNAVVTNTANDDIVGINFKVTYVADYADYMETTEPVPIKVTVSNIELDDKTGVPTDYILKDKVQKEDGSYDKLTVIETDNTMGTLFARKLAGFKISDGGQPKTEYTYGDTLDLSAAGIALIYDSGEVVDGIAYKDTAKYGISMKYSDSEDIPNEEDVITVPYHDGRTIVLTAPYQEEPVITEPFKVNKKLLTVSSCTAENIVYDGKTTLTTGQINLEGGINDDEISAQGTFNFEDCLAGENKTVNVTDITLSDETSVNYALASDKSTATASILKADITVPDKEGDEKARVEISENNVITVIPPKLPEDQVNGGAKFEYSVDGGKTWSDSPVFDNLELGHKYDVVMRIAGTDNYNESAVSKIAEITTYPTKITVINSETKEQIKSFFTKTTEYADESALIESLGVENKIYNLYADENKTRLSYPATLKGDVTLYASFKSSNTNNGNGGVSNRHETPKPTAEPTPTPVPSPSPTASPSSGKTIDKHYIDGMYGMVYPDNPLTRAEAAKMFDMQFESYSDDYTYETDFPDVKEETWYYKYVGFADNAGIISGFENGLYYPENNITRAELASIAVRYLGLEPSEAESEYYDVGQDTWYCKYIMALSEAGIITGYGDGSFAPEVNISRAEAITIINKMINRTYPHSEIDKMVCPFADLPKTHWAYYEVMIAASDLVR